MKLRLKKDIVIKAGTVFDTAATKIEMNDEFVEATFGLTKNTFGTILYDVSPKTIDEWADWFELAETRKLTKLKNPRTGHVFAVDRRNGKVYRVKSDKKGVLAIVDDPKPLRKVTTETTEHYLQRKAAAIKLHKALIKAKEIKEAMLYGKTYKKVKGAKKNEQAINKICNSIL